ncbi:Poly(A) polymerase [Macleaya cordata]|uniref:polynucleotide adenylyltransferase n=1 Tax=Macleaya cordata TaxID=56857 RepID=A0A200QSW8_MACCD|nr:Poly(A) polymerase [Macleaya cordata]
MAYVFPNHQRTAINLRSVISPFGFIPAPVVGTVINPSFRPRVEVLVPFNPPVVAPVGFTLNPAFLLRMDEERTQSLIQFMAKEGIVPSQEEELKRKDAITKLKQIVMEWIKKVAWQRGFPIDHIVNTSATILAYGSYGLGVHGSDSDIDALCIGPCFATMAEDFFIVLRQMLESRPEISELHCVKDAKIPLMRFKFDGISIDLPYAQLQVPSVPDNVDILNPFFLMNIDETSWKCLSGARANMRILQLVPNLEKFQLMLRCLKLWARRRGVYCNLVGFFGGIHMAVLTAYVCQRYPNASINTLISKFFETFALWPWPAPVMLEGSLPPLNAEHSLMPIQFPCGPHEFCRSNITRSTFHRIRTEFLRGHDMTRDILRPDFEWSSLFEPYPYTKKYKRFVRIFLAASSKDKLGDWVGWVKSRFRSLLLKLEEVQGRCDPNPTEYVDLDEAVPNVVFYWGLQPGRSSFTDIKSVEEYFMKNINNGYQGSHGRLELSIVDSSQLPKNAQFDYVSGKESKGYWRFFDYSPQPGKPIYSQYLPHYFVGYVATNPVPDYPSAGV